MSSKRRRLNVERRRVLAELVDERGPMCEARIEGVCTGEAVDGHELVKRSQGGSIVDPANIKLVCRRCHDWIEANPLEARRRGLARASWEL